MNLIVSQTCIVDADRISCRQSRLSDKKRFMAHKSVPSVEKQACDGINRQNINLLVNAADATCGTEGASWH